MALTPAQIVNTLAPIVGKVGAAGIAGNLQQESSDNPGDVGGGLAQWQGSRYTGLVKYAQSRGLPTTSAQAALGYLKQDLQGPYSGLASQLRSAKNPGHAAVLFSDIYERPGTPMIQNRINYAQQAFGSSGGKGLPALPKTQTSTAPQTTSTTKTVFDQQGFNQANARYIAGSFLQQAAKNNPYGSSGPSPLVSSGLLTTSAPSPADFQKTQTFTVAQNKLQAISGATPLNTHPVVGGDFKTPAPQKTVDMQSFAKSLIGAPYSKANHAGAFTQGAALIKKYGTDCSGLVSVLLGRAGVLSSPQTTDTIEGQPGIQAGRGKHVTIFNRANAGDNSHMIIQIGTDWFESGGRIGKGVVQMSDVQAQQELSGGGFAPLHPKGF